MSNIFTPRAGNTSKGGPSLPSGGIGLPVTTLVIVGVIVVAIFILWPFRTIETGEVGVKLRWGQAVDILRPGINIVVPGMESVIILPTVEKLYAPPPLNAYSKDTQVADVKVSVNYAIEENEAINVFSKYGASYVETIIAPAVNQRFKEVFGRYDSREIVNNRKNLGIEVDTAVRQAIPKGIIIKTVQIENIDFSDAYEQAIEAAAQAEAMVRKARQELEQKKVDAERVVVQAQADAQARVAAAKAEADAIRLKGEAEAGAIKAKADALRENPNLVALIATEKWDGKLPTTFVPGSAVPFVNVPRGGGN
jgi:regulator of protease activity HflC (stomatin/prohibitin superfamily)